MVLNAIAADDAPARLTPAPPPLRMTFRWMAIRLAPFLSSIPAPAALAPCRVNPETSTSVTASRVTALPPLPASMMLTAAPEPTSRTWLGTVTRSA